jgi:hypothetical protein
MAEAVEWGGGVVRIYRVVTIFGKEVLWQSGRERERERYHGLGAGVKEESSDCS